LFESHGQLVLNDLNKTLPEFESGSTPIVSSFVQEKVNNKSLDRKLSASKNKEALFNLTKQYSKLSFGSQEVIKTIPKIVLNKQT
tara:strand:- start:774 stop:1028 length:255 start_codon:yes stop_codon:yes gene_type:complete